MQFRSFAIVAIMVGSALMAGCANDGNLIGSSLTTSSVDASAAKSQDKQQAAKVDPECVALLSKIDGLRKEGTAERIEKAANGKSTMVSVKRASLQHMSELDKASADFQNKCSTLTPRPTQQTAAATPPAAAAPAAVAPAATPAAAPAAGKTAANAAAPVKPAPAAPAAPAAAKP